MNVNGFLFYKISFFLYLLIKRAKGLSDSQIVPMLSYVKSFECLNLIELDSKKPFKKNGTSRFGDIDMEVNYN